MRSKLTVLMTCKDEEKNIRACIESVLPVADELLLADSGSTDKTMEIARELGCRIIERELSAESLGDFKNWAIPQSTHSWVLIMDADERLTGPLVEEISKLLDKSPWSALARAARTRLQGFVETFESDDAGKRLAKILGKPAPDFTLSDLDGKQVNFRKETAGKVTLLSFWGVG